MVHNLKIDVIYYDTPADFELEFNLAGCCHSRILNSRASSPKEMLANLSKAVSRSRVILVLGAIHEGDGLITLISKAVGIPLTPVNKDEYFITFPDNPEVLKGSLPLISKDGILAGCIVESGPQSIILLPDSKSLRKEITDSLVFPYITALSRTPETEGVIKEELNEKEEPITDALSESEDKEPEAIEVPKAEENTEALDRPNDDESITYTENIETEDATDEFSDTREIELPIITTEISNNDDSIKYEADVDSLTEFDDNYIITDGADTSFVDIDTDDIDESDSSQPKGKLNGISIAILIICGLLLVIAAILVYLLVYSPISTAIPVSEYIKELFNFV